MCYSCMKAKSSPICCENSKLIYAPRLQASFRSFASKEQLVPTRRKRTRDEWIEPRPRGLWNSGQSCHLGSVIAALSAVSMLRDWLIEQDTTSVYETPFSLVKHYILECAPSSAYRRALDPRPLLTLLEQSGWKSRHARDAHETMARLLEILEDGYVAQSNQGTSPLGLGWRSEPGGCGTSLCYGKPPMADVAIGKRKRGPPFSALLSSSNKCHSCGFKSPTSFQSSFLLTLPIPRYERTLSELFYNTYMRGEEIDMRCDHCMQLGLHTRFLEMKRFPGVLVLHLQKAIYGSGIDASTRRQVALSHSLHIPVRVGKKEVARVETYSLRSVVGHKGVANTWSSHFDAVVSRKCEGVCEGLLGLTESRRWFHVDDQHISRCDSDTPLIPSQTYLVVYQRQDDRVKLAIR